MAKTTFVDGSSTIFANFMNSIFNTGGGHKHNGGSNDGEAGKIDPATEMDFGTNAAAPSKDSDNGSRVEWSFSHAAAGVFKLVVDHLGLSTLSPKSGDLIVVSDNTGLNFKDLKGRDLFFESLNMTSGPNLEVIATSIAKLWNNTGSAMATLQANISGETVSATGNVSGDTGTFTTHVDGPGSFWGLISFYYVSLGGTFTEVNDHRDRLAASTPFHFVATGTYDVDLDTALPHGTSTPIIASAWDLPMWDGEIVITARPTSSTRIRVKVTDKSSSAGVDIEDGQINLLIPDVA